MPINRRMALFFQQRGRCIWCGVACCLSGKKNRKKARAYFTVDHIVPRYLGGTSDSANLAGACQGCNGKRAIALNRNRDVLVQRFFEERRILNGHREHLYVPGMMLPLTPLTAAAMTARPWARSAEIYASLGLEPPTSECVDCGKLITGDLAGRTYCGDPCLYGSRGSRNRRALRKRQAEQQTPMPLTARPWEVRVACAVVLISAFVAVRRKLQSLE